jgi:poly(A) polymerase
MTNKHKEILDHCVNDDLLKLRSLFQAAGFDIRIVGGAVRDILCDQTPKDIDLCTSADTGSNRRALITAPFL